MRAAATTATAHADPAAYSAHLAVGFADIVSFTRLSRRLDSDALAAFIERFETTTGEIVAEARPHRQDPRRRTAVRRPDTVRRRRHRPAHRGPLQRGPRLPQGPRRPRLRRSDPTPGRRLRHPGEHGRPPDVHRLPGNGPARPRAGRRPPRETYDVSSLRPRPPGPGPSQALPPPPPPPLTAPPPPGGLSTGCGLEAPSGCALLAGGLALQPGSAYGRAATLQVMRWLCNAKSCVANLVRAAVGVLASTATGTEVRLRGLWGE